MLSPWRAMWPYTDRCSIPHCKQISFHTGSNSDSAHWLQASPMQSLWAELAHAVTCSCLAVESVVAELSLPLACSCLAAGSTVAELSLQLTFSCLDWCPQKLQASPACLNPIYTAHNIPLPEIINCLLSAWSFAAMSRPAVRYPGALWVTGWLKPSIHYDLWAILGRFFSHVIN